MIKFYLLKEILSLGVFSTAEESIYVGFNFRSINRRVIRYLVGSLELRLNLFIVLTAKRDQYMGMDLNFACRKSIRNNFFFFQKIASSCYLLVKSKR